MSTKCPAILTCSRTYGDRARLELCRRALPAQDSPHLASSHIDSVFFFYCDEIKGKLTESLYPFVSELTLRKERSRLLEEEVGHR